MKIILAILAALIPALSHAQKGVTSEPTVLYQKANLLLDAGETRQANRVFKKVIRFYEGEGRTQEVSESYLGMALAFAFNGHYPESIRYHKKALKAHRKYRKRESDDAIRMNLGLAYQLAGRDRKAKRYLF